jgi:hypothetical protein
LTQINDNSNVEDSIEWLGWKKTIKKIVKGSEDRKIKLKKLRKILHKSYEHANQTELSKAEFKATF